MWMVRKNRTTRNRWAAYLPVGVMVTPDPAGSDVARVEGWDPEERSGAGAWVPYPELLLSTPAVDVDLHSQALACKDQPRGSGAGHEATAE
ncbi:RNaseH domain-containing protein [Streptomyces sp. NPDC093223]|uniref:RNaseH domain-containing protein n=1 Tax=Streptomyces sp. NPDC093223 TaxID=3366033 RepID=UPI0038049EFD